MIPYRIMFCVLGILACASLTIHPWPSWWSDTTRYNGARTLEHKSYAALEIHGAATLDDITVEKTLLVTGSTELKNSTIRGNTTITGALEANDTTILANADIKGSLIAHGLKVRGTLTVHGSIEATNCEFGTIEAKKNKNETYSFKKSHFDELIIDGLGTKVVILKDSSAETIEFEYEGTVILKGSATVKDVKNGTIKKQESYQNERKTGKK